jgi:uncharacterized protein DUF6498
MRDDGVERGVGSKIRELLDLLAEDRAPEADPRRRDISTLALLVANAAPLFGVLFLHWQIFPLFIVYWLENLIVGLFNVLRIAFAGPRGRIPWYRKLVLIAVFCLQYGFFNFCYGMFVFGSLGLVYGESKLLTASPAELAAHAAGAVGRYGLGFAILSLVISHAVSFKVNDIDGGEALRATPKRLMIHPYSRIIVFHMTIMIGLLLMFALGSPVFLLATLVVIKTAMDLLLHRVWWRKPAAPTVREDAAQPVRVA